ncbi:MAG: ATP-grasp domain-containing protein, partial [Planctomycetota bacterium]
MTSKRPDDAVITSGSTIGILGSGQLGRMMAVAAKQMGYRVDIFSPSGDSPAGQVSDREIQGEYDDLHAIEEFAKSVDVVTVETENIPVSTLQAAAKHVPAFPGDMTLKVCQNRRHEKEFVTQLGIPTCNFHIVRSVDELQVACREIMPAILKTTTGGYDGKGQATINSLADVEQSWSALGADEAILEERIDFDFEFSIVGFRNSSGEVSAYRSIVNEHQHGILDISFSPSSVADDVNERATAAVFEIMNKLDSVGVLTVEFF